MTTNRSVCARRYVALAIKNLRRRPVRTGLTVVGCGAGGNGGRFARRLHAGLPRRHRQEHRHAGFPGHDHGQGLPVRGRDHDAQGRHGTALPARRYLRKGQERSGHRKHHADLRRRGAKTGKQHPREGSAKNFSIISGIDVPSYLVMKPWLAFKKGAGYADGRWFSPRAGMR